MKKHTVFFLFAIIIFMSLSSQALTAQDNLVRVIGHYDPPSNLGNEEVIFLTGINQGEFLEVIIEGTVYEFEHLQIGFEGEGNDFRIVEKEILNKLGTLTNRTLIIETYLPEGIPSERIKWKDGNGTDYQYDFYENGMGTNEWTFNIHDAPSYWPLSQLEVQYKDVGNPITEEVLFRYFKKSGEASYDAVMDLSKSPLGLYPVGWSADGKFAYVIVEDPGDKGELSAPVYMCIQDTVTDEVIYEERLSENIDEYRKPYADEIQDRDLYTDDPLITDRSAWELIASDFEAAMAESEIRKLDAADLLSFPVKLDNEEFRCTTALLKSKKKSESDRKVIFASDYQLVIGKSVSGSKIIYKGKSFESDESPVMGITVFGAFKSPFENRMAVLYGLWYADYLWDGTYEEQKSPRLELHLSGCHLGIGFK